MVFPQATSIFTHSSKRVKVGILQVKLEPNRLSRQVCELAVFPRDAMCHVITLEVLTGIVVESLDRLATVVRNADAK